MKKILLITSAFCLLLTGAGCSRDSSKTITSNEPDPTNGHLLRGATITTVYYLGSDGKRYVFPNEKTYNTWFKTFAYVRRIPDEDLSKNPLGGNVTYKPGSRLIKIESDPRVYAVAHGGILREITSEDVAEQLFGKKWRALVDDLPDPFFTNYTLGQPIASVKDFSSEKEKANALSIDQDKELPGTRSSN